MSKKIHLTEEQVNWITQNRERLNEYVNGTHVTPSGNISDFSLDFLGSGEKGGKGGLQHTDGIYISINPIGNAKFHKTYGSKDVVQKDDVDELGRGGYKVYTYFLQIPDLSREYYMFEYEPISKYPHILKSVNDKLSKHFGDGAGIFLKEDGSIQYSLPDVGVKTVANEPFINATSLTCANFYRLVKEIFFKKDGKKTSEFFSECGVVGLIYHGHQDALCAVIYNPQVIKIVDKKIYNVKKGASGDDIKKDYINTSDYAERLSKYNSEHQEEYSEREKYKGHIAMKPKNYIAGKKYDSPLNFQYPIGDNFKNDKSHNLSESKHTPITVLWLDDVREPNKYLFDSSKKMTGARERNLSFYTEFYQKYKPTFVWVKNFEEFTNYILKNGVPEFVSFDHDLGRGLKNGAECASWLKDYCHNNSLPLPKFYAHSANTRGRIKIEDIMSQTVNEDVFANRATIRGRKNKVVDLSYKMHNPTNNRNFGNLASFDMLGTEKMDKLDADTIEHPLKGGIMSYNITSIKGKEVMHYFKRKYAHDNTPTSLNCGGVDYELHMDEEEFQYFVKMFNEKVNRVLNYRINEFKKENREYKPTKVSIYPVPSSERFNYMMAQIMSRMSLAGLPVQAIDEHLLQKDLRNIQKDEDFIAKNKKFFDTNFSDNKTINGYDKSVMTHLEDNMRKFNAHNEALKYVNQMNIAFDEMMKAYYTRHSNVKEKTETIVSNFRKYYDALKSCTRIISYQSFARKEGDDARLDMDTIATPIMNAKGRPVSVRSEEIWKIVKPNLRNEKCPITGQSYKGKGINITKWKPTKFQIKNFSNGERMGLKNYYNPNEDVELVKRELERIKGGVFVIFDDNISGGATLSDICYQCKQLGIEYIIPITFGKMEEKWTMHYAPLNKPTNDAGEYGKFNYK